MLSAAPSFNNNVKHHVRERDMLENIFILKNILIECWAVEWQEHELTFKKKIVA